MLKLGFQVSSNVGHFNAKPKAQHADARLSFLWPEFWLWLFWFNSSLLEKGMGGINQHESLASDINFKTSFGVQVGPVLSKHD